MDLDGVSIQPAEGKVALRFVDDLDDDGDMSSNAIDADYDGLLAIVLGVGAKVSGIKKGDTVICQPYARDGLSTGDNTVIVESYCIAGTIK